MTGIVALIVLATLLLAVIAFAKSPFFKGWFGEAMINIFLPMKLRQKGYYFLKDVTLPTSDGRTTQIDHIIVSRYGVFVMETKNLRGWIFGTADDATWTQKFRRSSFSMQNPLRQNYKHVKVLQELLQLPDRVFQSVVFLGPDCRFKKEKPPGLLTTGYSKYIASFTQDLLTEEQVKTVLEKIQQTRLAPGLKTHRQHVENVRQIIAEKNKSGPARTDIVVATSSVSPSVPACPLCGSVMVARVARRGKSPGEKFWGCSGYPKCRGICKVTG